MSAMLLLFTPNVDRVLHYIRCVESMRFFGVLVECGFGIHSVNHSTAKNGCSESGPETSKERMLYGHIIVETPKNTYRLDIK